MWALFKEIGRGTEHALANPYLLAATGKLVKNTSLCVKAIFRPGGIRQNKTKAAPTAVVGQANATSNCRLIQVCPYDS